MATQIASGSGHWRLRFGLRGMAISIVLAALLCAWLGKERRQSELEQHIGKQFQSEFIGPYDRIELRSQGLRQGWWRDCARGVLGVRAYSISLSGSDDLTSIAAFTNVQVLRVSHKTVSEAKALAALTTLRSQGPGVP
jgi:hypothetical protein